MLSAWATDIVKQKHWTWVSPQCIQKAIRKKDTVFMNADEAALAAFRPGHATNSHCYRKGSAIYFYKHAHATPGTALRLYMDSPHLCELPRRRRPTPHDVVLNFVQTK